MIGAAYRVRRRAWTRLVHARLAKLLSRYDGNGYAVSVKGFAVKPL